MDDAGHQKQQQGNAFTPVGHRPILHHKGNHAKDGGIDGQVGAGDGLTALAEFVDLDRKDSDIPVLASSVSSLSLCFPGQLSFGRFLCVPYLTSNIAESMVKMKHHFTLEGPQGIDNFRVVKIS